MKNIGLKIATLALCLPSLASAGVRLTGANSVRLAKGVTTAQVTTALKAANLEGVDAANLVKAIDSNIAKTDELNTIINNQSGKIDDATKLRILTLVAAEANYTMIEAIPGNQEKLSGAREKLLSLAVQIDKGSTHNQTSMGEIAATLSDNYAGSSPKMPSEIASLLEATIAKTATAEAKAEAERTGKSLLELFAKCK